MAPITLNDDLLASRIIARAIVSRPTTYTDAEADALSSAIDGDLRRQGYDPLDYEDIILDIIAGTGSPHDRAAAGILRA